LSAGASPPTPLEELTVLPRPPSWFRGRGPREREGEGGEKGGGGQRGGEGREGKGVPECLNSELASLATA